MALGGCGEHYLKNEVKWVNPEKVKKIFTDPDSSQFGEYVKARKVMQWGGLSDQFDENERKYGKTLELLRFFREIDYPLSFSTKATWWLDDERYVELFRNNPKWNVKFSIITLEEEKDIATRRLDTLSPWRKRNRQIGCSQTRQENHIDIKVKR